MKKIIGYALLGFVAVSVGYAIFKETRGVSQTAQMSGTQGAVDNESAAMPAGSQGTATNSKTSVRTRTLAQPQTRAPVASPAAKPSPAGQIVIARYCHSYARCQNCLKIEKYSREAIETRFRKELDSGILRFETVNVEEPANRHYVKDYGLYTKSLVLVAQAGGGETRYKVLNDVWNHLGDKDAFLDYVRKETEGFLK